MKKPRPRDVVLDRPRRLLRVTWSDGHESVYPFAELRYHCPCATCQRRAEEGTLGQTFPTDIGDPNTLRQVIVAGTYALQFVWEDGHSAGFYTFDYLRGLCRCEACRGE
jgi:DUF971 family protein